MIDDTSNTGGQHRQRINVNQDYELRDWSSKLSVSPEKLKEAVAAVGDQAFKVAQYLRGNDPKGPKRARHF